MVINRIKVQKVPINCVRLQVCVNSKEGSFPMKTVKRILCFVLALITVAGLIPGNVICAEAASNIYINGVDIGYTSGDYFTKNGKSCVNTVLSNGKCHDNNICVASTDARCNCMRYWPTGSPSTCRVDLMASQCFGFARYCQYAVYGYHDGNKPGKFVDLTGKISAANCTASNLKAKLINCAPATHLRTGNGGHSVVIISTSNSGVELVHANYDGYCRIKALSYTWAELASYFAARSGIQYAKSAAEKTDTEHTCDKGTYKWYWADHPHYKCYACSICGKVNAFKDEKVTMTKCESCRPGKPVLNVDATNNGTATFTWKETANTTHYNLLIKKKNNGKMEVISQHAEVKSGFSVTLEAGEYSAQLRSYNSNMKESDGSDWVHTSAEDVSFSIAGCNHKFSSVVNQAATCTKNGKETFTCKKCGYSYSTELDKLGHKYVTDAAKAATCTEDGLTKGKYCAVCNKVQTEQSVIPATGHSWDDGVVTKQPKEGVDGEERLTCTVCQATMTKTIIAQKPVHTYNAVVSAPSLTVSNVASSGKIKLSWKKVDGAVKYEVYRSESADGKFSRLTTTKNTAVTNTSAVAGKTYYYYIVAVAEDGTKSDRSKTRYRTCDLACPEVKLSNVASTGKIKLSWDKVDGATKYSVDICDENGNLLKTSSTTKTSLTHNSAVAGVRYTYKVRALCNVSAAASAKSSAQERVCDLAQPEVTLTNVASSGKIKISWEKVEGAVKYEVYRAASENGSYTKITTVKDTSVTNTKADAGKTYYYKVKAVAQESEANSAYSAVMSLTCKLARPDVSVAISSDKPQVSWSEVNGATGYKVYRAASKNGSYTLVKKTTSLSFKDSDAPKGKTCYYKVVAVCADTKGNSAFSAVQSIKFN